MTAPGQEGPTVSAPTFRLDDRVALVTGGSAGIGLAVLVSRRAA